MTTKQALLDNLAKSWYSALDTHEPLHTLTEMLDPKDLKMIFPEATLSGIEGFTSWYEGVIRIFFDEVHQVQKVEIMSDSANSATVSVVVKWEASRWRAPSAKSERIMLLAYQTWEVDFATQASGLIKSYTVDRLEYLPGSASL